MKRLVHSLIMISIGLLVGILVTYGILAVSGFSSMTVVCELNGTASIINASQFSGAIVLIVGIFIGPVLVLLYDKLKKEYEEYNEAHF